MAPSHKKCLIPTCNLNDLQKSFHQVPANFARLEKWIQNMSVAFDQDSFLQLHDFSTICNLHFEESCFKESLSGRRFLKNDAAPTIFLKPADMAKLHFETEEKNVKNLHHDHPYSAPVEHQEPLPEFVSAANTSWDNIDNNLTKKRKRKEHDPLSITTPSELLPSSSNMLRVKKATIGAKTVNDNVCSDSRIHSPGEDPESSCLQTNDELEIKQVETEIKTEFCEEDEFDNKGREYADILRMLDTSQREIVEKLLDDAITQAKLDLLTRNSCIFTPID